MTPHPPSSEVRIFNMPPLVILEDSQNRSKFGRYQKPSLDSDVQETPSKQGSVLVIEDHPDGRMMLVDLLEIAGYQVSCAAHGQEALDILRSTNEKPLPSLILLDLYMPVMDGWGFLQEQGRDEKLRGIPVVVLSAVAKRAELETTGIKPVAFLEKPVDPKELFKTVEQHRIRRSGPSGTSD